MEDKSQKDFDEDYAYSRQTYRALIQECLDVIPKLKDLAEEVEHPRAYEVLFQGIKHAADINDKLANHHRKYQVMDHDGKKLEADKPVEIEDKSEVFQGTTVELQEALERMRDTVAEDAEFEEIDKSDG